MTKNYCSVCGIQFSAMRSSAKYCSESCKQKAKRNRAMSLPESDMLNDFYALAGQLAELKDRYMTDSHSPEMQLEVFQALDSIRHETNKMQAYLGTVEQAQNNSWYECLNCGQKCFGLAQKCDFCGEKSFKLAKI